MIFGKALSPLMKTSMNKQITGHMPGNSTVFHAKKCPPWMWWLRESLAAKALANCKVATSSSKGAPSPPEVHQVCTTKHACSRLECNKAKGPDFGNDTCLWYIRGSHIKTAFVAVRFRHSIHTEALSTLAGSLRTLCSVPGRCSQVSLHGTIGCQCES